MIEKIILYSRTIMGQRRKKKSHLIRLDNALTLCGQDTAFELLRERKNELCKGCLNAYNARKLFFTRV